MEFLPKEIDNYVAAHTSPAVDKKSRRKPNQAAVPMQIGSEFLPVVSCSRVYWKEEIQANPSLFDHAMATCHVFLPSA